MSCRCDLDGFTTRQIRDEIERRDRYSKAGVCWYCLDELATHDCRHAGRGRPAYLSGLGRPTQDGTCGDTSDGEGDTAEFAVPAAEGGAS